MFTDDARVVEYETMIILTIFVGWVKERNLTI